MLRNTSIILMAVLVIALPFIFRRAEETMGWKPGDPVLVVISPHNEAIRYEFGRAFSEWHRQKYGQPVKVDWRVIGGTSEIMRYLAAEYVSACRAWWIATGGTWPDGGGEMVLDRRFDPEYVPPDVRRNPSALARWELKRDLHQAVRANDSAAKFTTQIDLFFGGGAYDHGKACAQGITVPPWSALSPPEDTISNSEGTELIPERLSGETWRDDTFFGAALSTFGICYNTDRLNDLGIVDTPSQWLDLTDIRYYRQLGVADPTKSGSIAKAFEMIIHEQCHHAVREAGFTPEQVDDFETHIRAAHLPPGELPEGVPPGFQIALEQGWLDGLRLVQRIGANARYFTDSASKVPIDVSTGDAAAGIAIDFYGRYQAEMSKSPEGAARMVYVTPTGGSSVSADPISLLRGAPHRELAVRFMTFVLGEPGQRLWNYAPGTPGGPTKFALRRLPIRRDFYPSDDAHMQAAHERHATHAVDALSDPSVNPYELAGQFMYHARWTGQHFNIHRDLITAMCLDAGEELRAAWLAIVENGGPEKHADAVQLMARMPDRPVPLTWTSALAIGKSHRRLDYMREWTIFFRQSYREAELAAREKGLVEL